MLVPFFPSFLRLGITMACIWNFAKIILGCINYFHNYVSEFMKKDPLSVESWHAYPYCRQVKISFLGMPQIAHFQVEKLKSSLPWEGGHPRPTPFPRSVATLPRAWSLRSLAKIVPPPPNVLAHYATALPNNVNVEITKCEHLEKTTRFGVPRNFSRAEPLVPSAIQQFLGQSADGLSFSNRALAHQWHQDFGLQMAFRDESHSQQKFGHF